MVLLVSLNFDFREQYLGILESLREVNSQYLFINHLKSTFALFYEF